MYTHNVRTFLRKFIALPLASDGKALMGYPDKDRPPEFPERAQGTQKFHILSVGLGETETGVENPVFETGFGGPAGERPEIFSHFGDYSVRICTQRIHSKRIPPLVHRNISETEFHGCRQHPGIFFSGGNVIYDEMPGNVKGATDYRTAGCVKGKLQSARKSLEQRLQTTPLLPLTYKSGTRPGRHRTYVEEVHAAVEHTRYPLQRDARVTTRTLPKRIGREIDYAHYLHTGAKVLK